MKHASSFHPPTVGRTDPPRDQDGRVPLAADPHHRGTIPHLRIEEEVSGQRSAEIWSCDLAAPAGEAMPAWMIELAEQVGMIEELRSATGALLPTGVIVGTAVIEKVSQVSDGFYGW